MYYTADCTVLLRLFAMLTWHCAYSTSIMVAVMTTRAFPLPIHMPRGMHDYPHFLHVAAARRHGVGYHLQPCLYADYAGL